MCTGCVFSYFFGVLLLIFFIYPIIFDFAESTVFSDPAFKKQNLSFMTQEQRYTHSVGLTIKAIKKMRELDITDNQQQWWFKE